MSVPKQRVDEILSKIEIRTGYNGDEYHHLEVADWLELDQIKYDLAREDWDGILNGDDSFGDTVSYSFGFDDGWASATLSFKSETAQLYVHIILEADPSKNIVDPYQGDDNQAWMLFNSLDYEDQEDFLAAVDSAGDAGVAVREMLTAAEPPMPGPTPLERAAYTPRVGEDGAPTFVR